MTQNSTDLKPQRTKKQNNAIHVFCRLLSKELNESGLDMRTVLEPGVEIPWTEETVKKFIWKPIQEAYIGRESTTQLNTYEVSAIWEILNRHLAEKFNIHVPFPSSEEQAW